MNNYEALRLSALVDSNLLDRPSSDTLDALLELAKRAFNVKVVAVSLVDKDRQWFKSQIGLDCDQTRRDVAFCSHTIDQEEPLIVLDASKDDKFSNNPLVIGAPHIRFYSGISLKSAIGFKLGSFCLIDDSPRTFSIEDLALQRKLAYLIEIELNRLSEIPMSDKPAASDVNQSVLNALHIFLKTDDQPLTFDVMLNQMLVLTESSFGFIAEVKGSGQNRYLKMRSITNIAWNKETYALYNEHNRHGLEFHNLNNMMGEPIKTLRPVISNDFKHDVRAKGLAQGHPDINSYCGIPLMSGNEVIGVIGLANRKAGYSTGFVNSITAITLTAGVLIQRDRMLQERHTYTQKLYEAAHLDDVTNLPNRRSLSIYLSKLIELSDEANPFALCFLDLDGFKHVNDSLGHEFGDGVLKLVATRLKHLAGKHNFVARISGDEFVVIIKRSTTKEFERIITALNTPFNHLSQSIDLSASAGVAMFPKDGKEIDILLRHADQAMYLAKQAGKNRYALFDVNLHNKHQEKLKATQAVIDALENQQIVPYLQPKFLIKDKSIIGFEVLSRWDHPEKGILAPGSFLPDIQETHAQILHDDYIFTQCISILDAVHEVNSEFTLNINISAEYFNSAEFMHRVKALAREYPNHVQNFVLEIVESTTLGELASAVNRLTVCRNLGFRISLDDFGTSYSSLTYFRDLPVDEVKIDKIFIDDMLDDPLDLSIVRAVIDMAKAFSRTVVAEGVETEEQLRLLQKIGCHSAQGYLFAKPMPLLEAITFCKRL